MASCNGGARENDVDSETIHCGNRKGDWYDPVRTVSPLAEDCESFFRYTLAGEMVPSREAPNCPAAEETIERLNLNSARLRRLRKKAIDGALTPFPPEPDTSLNLSAEQLSRIEQRYAKTNEGRYERFCMAVVDVARQFLQAPQSSGR
jgi:hypothetical protein